MIYAIFKPYDREQEMGLVEDEMPTWAKSFFEKFESNKFVSKLVGYNKKVENETEREMSPALNPEELAETSEKFRKLINERRNSNVGKNSLILYKIRDFNRLSPKCEPRAIFAEKSAQKKSGGFEQNAC